MRQAVGLVSGVLSTLLIATPATADPCTEIPDRGPMPAYLRPGAQFSGTVTYVGDGDSLCVGVRPEPSGWIEVRLADFYAPELSAPGGHQAKAALGRIAMGRQVQCVAQHRSYDRVVARCTLQGRGLGDLLRAEGAREGGKGY